ncbi:MAG: hypothetical protein JO292_10005 [Betaproteobacteria bacterium]|nr:hypothetical protein [Betaproteobacteria bacterium]MBV9361714.1 hypothetical protein [Betaproteobacteria bacterium]
MRTEGFAIKTAFFWLLVIAALSGCQATQYRRATPAGGFGEIQLEGDIWRIRFTHNAFTTRETAQSYWLYRAAELTISKGYDGFEVVSQLGRVRSYGDALSKRSVFVIEGEIRMLKEPFESVPPKTYNAEALISVLNPYVNGPNSEPVPASEPTPTLSSSEPPPPSSADGLKLKTIDSIQLH